MNIKKLYTEFVADIEKVWAGKRIAKLRTDEASITSVALRALGALVMLIAAAVLLSGIGLAFTGSIGSGVFTAIGALVLGALAYDLVQVGVQTRTSGVVTFKDTILATHIARWMGLEARV